MLVSCPVRARNPAEPLVRMEEAKVLPFGEIWGEWFDETQKYEAEVLSKRGN